MTANLKIWGRTNSTNVKKALWIAHELGLQFESVIVGGPYGGLATSEYRALNPNQVIPTIQDGSFVLWESNAIVRYLAEQYSSADAQLWPTDASQRADGDKWMDWTSTTFGPKFRPVFWGMVRTAPEQRNLDEIKQGIDNVSALLAIPEATLAKQPYLSGNEFGIGDIPLGCFIYAWFEMDIERPDTTPHLRAWYERLKSRPAYKKAVLTPLT